MRPADWLNLAGLILQGLGLSVGSRVVLRVWWAQRWPGTSFRVWQAIVGAVRDMWSRIRASVRSDNDTGVAHAGLAAGRGTAFDAVVVAATTSDALVAFGLAIFGTGVQIVAIFLR